jgi:hypothetical protein
MNKDIEWFKQSIYPLMSEYSVSFKSFLNGDFGDIERVDFKNERLGGSIDFWSSGWLGVYVYSYEKEKELYNVLLEADENLEKEEAFRHFEKLVFSK